MFYENKIPAIKSNRKTFKYNLFHKCQDSQTDDFIKKGCESKSCFNFITQNGGLESGYGFSTLKAPTNFTSIESEEEISLVGEEISAVWSFKWFNNQEDKNQYYVMYYNGSENFHYDNLFSERPLSLTIPTQFSSTPISCAYRIDDQDVLVFSGEGSPLQVVGANFNVTVEEAPKLLSICSHYDKLFAITGGARGSLVYTQNTDLLKWNDETINHISFSDERGNLNKIISFNDYIYLFRDFGITKVSTYSTKGDFSISHLYQADGYIYPGSIASSGDNIYFLERSGLKVFNGSSTKSIKLDCDNLLVDYDNSNSCGVCYEGKYYLACRIEFNDEKSVGCENHANYINNALFVYDINTGAVEISRGMDIKSLTVLNNPYKSKLVACFNYENKAKIGQIEKNGMCFNQELEKEWTSVKTDFNHAGSLKKIKKIHLISKYDCKFVIKSDKEEKSIEVTGSNNPQTICTNVLGKIFQISIIAKGQAKISNVEIEFLERS